MAEQLTFDLPAHTALGRGEFFVSAANTAAVAAIQSCPDWTEGKLVLVGPPASGKTHLAHVWAALTGAAIQPAGDLAQADVAALAAGPVAVEDADTIAGIAPAEAALLHLHNLARAQNQPLLVTATHPPARWPPGLPDLASRMQASAMVTLNAPDDPLLAAVLVKLFGDRQIAVDAGVVSYLVARMERSFAAAGRLVAALDAAALAQKRPITRALAGGVLDKLHPDGA